MKAGKIVTLLLTLTLVLIFSGCDEEEIIYPPKTNRLEVNIDFTENSRYYTAKDNVQIIEDPDYIYTFTAQDEVGGIVNESWTIKFEVDPGTVGQEQEILISDSYSNRIRLDTPNDDLYGDYLIETGDMNAEITKIIITKFIPGEEIQGEFYGNIHEIGTTSNDSLRLGFFHTNNFISK
ncbi:MAG: hypothetical protein JXR69_05280 [Candidatus Delongbacteria bacterium]|nr:hypothetical protein [Candidatus Delongbacteria bacterium]